MKKEEQSKKEELVEEKPVEEENIALTNFEKEQEEKSSWFSKRETKNVQKLFNYHIIATKIFN